MRAGQKERRKERKGKDKRQKVDNNKAQTSRISGVTPHYSCHCGPFVWHLNDKFNATECQELLSK